MAAYERWLVVEEDFPQLIFDRISATHEDPTTVELLRTWVDVSSNLALDILPKIAAVWKNGVKRTVADASDRQNGEFRDLYAEMAIDQKALEWNPQGTYLGEILAMPQVIDGEAVMITALPHMYEVVPGKIPGTAAGYIYMADVDVYERGRENEAHNPEHARGDFILVDKHGWTRFDGSTGKQTDYHHHGFGYIPAIPLRQYESFGNHYWTGCKRGQRMHDATIAAAMVNTTMNFIRKGQNKHLLVAMGKTKEIVGVANPETGIAVRAAPGQMDVKTLPFDTDPINSIRQIAWCYQSVAQQYGGFSYVDTAKDGTTSFRVEFSHEEQTEQRNKQLPFCRRFERRLAIATADVVRLANHKVAHKLPSKSAILDGFTTDFGQLSRRFADPQAEEQHFEFLKRNGCASQFDLMRKQEGTHLTDARMMTMIESNLDVCAKVNDAITSRDLGMGSGEVVTAAEANGAQGGAAKHKPKPGAKSEEKTQQDD